jgi:AcrR family transcriptional regulator
MLDPSPTAPYEPDTSMTVTHPDRSPRRRVPRNTLNADRILDAALGLLDRHGTEAFTMRALAAELGVGTMAVYSHFRNKDEITDAVHERLLSTIELPARAGGPCAGAAAGTAPGGPANPVSPADARAELREVCCRVHRLFSDHPSALQLLTTRPMRGDEAIAVIDRMLALLRAAGLAPAAAARAHLALLQYTVGSAVWTARRRAAAQAAGETGRTDRSVSCGPAGPAAPAGRAAAPPGGQTGPCGPAAPGATPRERLAAKLSALPPGRYETLAALAPELLEAQECGPGQYELGLDAMLAGLLPG